MRLLLTLFCAATLGAQTCDDLLNLVRQRAAAANWKEARSLAESANPDTQCAGALMYEIADAALQSGDFAAAENFGQRSLFYLQKTHPSGDILLFRPLQILASVYVDEHQLGRARRVAEQLSATQNQAAIHRAWVAGIRGTIFHIAGESENAEREYRVSLELWENTGSVERHNSIEPLNNLSSLYLEQGRLAEARAIVTRAQRVLDSSPEAFPVDKIVFLDTMAVLSYLEHDYPAAAESFRQASQIASALPPLSYGNVAAGLLSNYAFVLRKMNRKREAKVQKARADFLRNQTGNPSQTQVVDLTQLKRSKY